MGVGISPFYDDHSYYGTRGIYPNRRIIYVTQPGTVLVPQNNIPYGMMPINQNPRLIIANPQNFPNPHIRPGPMPIMMIPMQNQPQKRTINNLKEIFGETELTQSILDKGEQKKCSICLEDFEVGTKIIYLPCFHYYHAKCIETWVKNSDKCPLCNTEIKIPQ